MSFIVEAEVLEHRRVAEGCYRLCFRAPQMARAAVPGQFVHVRCGPTHDPLLRRPFGVQDADRAEGIVCILYQVVGRGTALLTKVRPGVGIEPGDRISVLGPLGRGFSPPADAQCVALVAGGLGIGPLCLLYKRLTARGVRTPVFHGIRTAGVVAAADLLTAVDGNAVMMASDDGSLGRAGSVVDLFKEHTARERPDFFCAAGPAPMLRALSALVRESGIPGEVSLEERMGCGIGACLVCSCRTRDGDKARYSRVCADGPVFPVAEVVWR